MMGMFFFLTQFLRGVLGYSDLKTGFAFVPLTAAVFVSSQLSSRVLVERFGGRRLMIIGTLLSTSGMFLLTQLSENSSYFALVLPLLVFGTGNGLAFVPLTTTAIDGVEAKDAGAASGLVNVMQQVGGALGLSVLVTIFGSAFSHAQAHVSAGPVGHPGVLHVYVYGGGQGLLDGDDLPCFATLLLVTFVIQPARNPSRPRESGVQNWDELAGETGPSHLSRARSSRALSTELTARSTV